MSLLNYVPYVLSCPTCLVPSVLSCLTCLVPHVPRALPVLVPYVSGASRVLARYVPRAPRALAFYVLRAQHASCHTYFCASCSMWLCVSHFMSPFSSRTLLFCTLRTLCPNITFCALEIPCITLLFFCSFATCDFFWEIFF